MGMGDWAQESEDPWGDHAAGGWEDDSNYPGRGHSWPGSLDEGVRLGYQIVEDHIRRGERASHHFAERAMGSMRSGDGLWELFLRLVQASGPIAAAGSQFLDALARLGRPPHHRFGSQHFEPRWADSHWSEHEAYGPDGSTEPDAPWNWPESAPGMSPHSDDLADTGEGEDEIRFRVRLDLGRPIVLELCLDTWAQSTEIQVQELVSSDPSLPPLQGIEFDTGEGWLDVHVGSLEAPPPGVYTGIVLESSSGEPCGELTARVGAPTPSPHPSDEAPVDEPMYPQDELET